MGVQAELRGRGWGKLSPGGGGAQSVTRWRRDTSCHQGEGRCKLSSEGIKESLYSKIHLSFFQDITWFLLKLIFQKCLYDTKQGSNKWLQWQIKTG